MTRSKPRLAGVLLAAAAVAATLVVPASPAAAHSPYEACSSGYVLVAKPRAVKTSDGVVYGKVYLVYNNDNGKNCAVTIKTRFHGKKTGAESGCEQRA